MTALDRATLAQGLAACKREMAPLVAEIEDAAIAGRHNLDAWQSRVDRAVDELADRQRRAELQAKANAAIELIIATGARHLLAEPWRVERIIRRADQMSFGELCTEVSRRLEKIAAEAARRTAAVAAE